MSLSGVNKLRACGVRVFVCVCVRVHLAMYSSMYVRAGLPVHVRVCA